MLCDVLMGWMPVLMIDGEFGVVDDDNGEIVFRDSLLSLFFATWQTGYRCRGVIFVGCMLMLLCFDWLVLVCVGSSSFALP